MKCRLRTAVLALEFVLLGGLPAGAADNDAPKKQEPKKPAPTFAELLKGSPEDFMKRFDKDRKGYLTRKDLPQNLAGLFDRSDANKDGKLDRKEVEALMAILRRRAGGDTPGVDRAEVERLVNQLLAQMDANKDGKISRAEAQGNIATSFDQIDTNKDGFLDRDELRRAMARYLANQKKQADERRAEAQRAEAAAASVPDFDALDRNADGRLTRDELKGTPYADQFDQIDANGDGKLDRKEWEAYFRKQAEKRAAAEKNTGENKSP